MEARLSFRRLNKPRDFWSSVLQTDDTSVEVFGLHIQNQTQQKPFSPTVEHGGGGVMIWGHVAVAEWTVNSSE